jgi:hypothetical protein
MPLEAKTPPTTTKPDPVAEELQGALKKLTSAAVQGKLAGRRHRRRRTAE